MPRQPDFKRDAQFGVLRDMQASDTAANDERFKVV